MFFETEPLLLFSIKNSSLDIVSSLSPNKNFQSNNF